MKKEAREHCALYSHAYIVNQDSSFFPLLRGIFKILSVVCPPHQIVKAYFKKIGDCNQGFDIWFSFSTLISPDCV